MTDARGEEASDAAGAKLEVVVDDLGFGPQITALVRGDRRVEFLPGPLFALTLRHQPTARYLRLSTEEPTIDAFETAPGVVLPLIARPFQATTDGLALRFVLRPYVVSVDEKLVATVDVRMAIVDDVVRFDIEVDFVAKEWSLFSVDYPLLRMKPSDDPALDVAVLPWTQGGIVRDPGAGLRYGEQGFLREYHHPGWQASMQFAAFYAKGGPTLFLQTKDRGGYDKLVFWDAEDSTYSAEAHWPPRWARFRFTHFPKNNARPGGVPGELAYRNPYPIEAALIEGGWYQAARRYRKWATTEVEAKRGTIAASKTYSAKQRVQDVGLARGAHRTGDFSSYVRDLRRMAEYFDSKGVGCLWYVWYQNGFAEDWPDYVVNPAAPAAMKRASDEGFAVIPYSIVQIWDSTISFAARYDAFRYACKTPEGSPLPTGVVSLNEVSSALYFRFYDMNPRYEIVREIALERWAGLATALAFDGIYMDDFGAQSNIIDYDPSVPVSGGTDDYAKGKRAFGEEFLRRCKALDERGLPRRDFTLVGEFPNEFVVDLVELTSAYDRLRPLPSFLPIPLWSVVFHDYIMSAETYTPGLPLLGGDYTFSTLARAFHSGRAFALVNEDDEPIVDILSAGPNRPFLELIRLFTSTNRALRRFRLWGERLESPPGAHEREIDRGGPLDADVQASVWRFGDELALVASNTADDARTFATALPHWEYPIPESATLFEIDAEGAYVEPRPYDGSEFEIVLPPRSVRAFVVREADADGNDGRRYMVIRTPASVSPTDGDGLATTPSAAVANSWPGSAAVVRCASIGAGTVVHATLLRWIDEVSAPVVVGGPIEIDGVGEFAFDDMGSLSPGAYGVRFEVITESVVVQAAFFGVWFDGTAV